MIDTYLEELSLTERWRNCVTPFSMLIALSSEEISKCWLELREFTRQVLRQRGDDFALTQFEESNAAFDRRLKERARTGNISEQDIEIRAFRAWTDARHVASSAGYIALWEMPLIPLSNNDRGSLINQRKQRVESQLRDHLRTLLKCRLESTCCVR